MRLDPRRRRPWIVGAVTAAVGLVCWIPFAGRMLVLEEPLSGPEIIVSLASHEWERLPTTAAVARSYPAALVLLTQPETVTPYNCHDCENRVQKLERLGVPRTRTVVVPLTSAGTFGEALAVRRLARSRRLHRLLVVTSPYHSRRALDTFRAVFGAGSEVVGVVPARDSPAQPLAWWTTPYDRAYVAYEWSARVYYAVGHGVLPTWM